ncbi:ribose transport system permease protein [Phycicoccus badiiscoriae]|uniref:Ribose transport system permease protein n=1 Tax=Pedococcus badiiscoriae TaxID=642776 RepID=A0A852WGY0_9MICO|nr:ABC transporter permease [Pedococcus badiiscoriae]NYG06791.1 ribose transport system permease protein [Pedococcus badiiscoriae]
MSRIERDPELGTEKGYAASSAPSELAITTPTEPAGGPAGDAVDAVAASGVSARSRLIRRGFSSSPAYMFAVLVVMFVIFSALSPTTFPTQANVKNLVVDTSIVLVMSVGMTYVMVAAGFDLSIGSVLVFAGICAVKTMTWVGGQGYGTALAGLVAALLGGVAWGLFNGFCVTRLRVPALITTLGTLGAALGIANLMTNGNDISVSQKSMIQLQIDDVLGMPWIVWLSLVVVLIGGAVLRYTRFGRHTYVIGSNDEAARRAGINVNAHLVKLYAISGALAGLAGMMSLVRFSTTTIGGHSQDALTVITGVILGGTSLYGGYGVVLGTVIGIFIPTVLQNGLVVQNVQPFWQNVAIGFILIGAVYLDQLKRRARDKG